MLQVVQEDTNKHEKYAIVITKGGCLIRGTQMRYQRYAFFMAPSIIYFIHSILLPSVCFGYESGFNMDKYDIPQKK